MPIYESPDKGATVYRREPGHVDRELIRYDNRTSDGRPLYDHILEDKLWATIRRDARTNPALQSELDRVIMFYHLSKKQT
jgi:hypothetical protein